MRRFTIFYAVTGQNRGYVAHHMARVTAEHNVAAIERCKADVLPDFDFELLAVLAGDDELELVQLGPRLLVHRLGAAT